MRRFITFWIAIFVACSLYAKEPPDIKLLVLVIANDDTPIYSALQNIWRSYMHLDPEHVTAYFIKGDPSLPTDYAFSGDTIWCKTEESIRPGILNKTILALEANLPRIHEYDYLLRTNLSSFYVFPRLLEILEKMPRENFCFSSGISYFDPPVIAGCGYILSTDLIEMILQNKRYLFNARQYDDILLGQFLLRRKKIPLVRHNRTDLFTLQDWLAQAGHLTDLDTFHFRIKNPKEELRMEQDLFIHSELLKIFYPETL